MEMIFRLDTDEQLLNFFLVHGEQVYSRKMNWFFALCELVSVHLEETTLVAR